MVRHSADSSICRCVVPESSVKTSVPVAVASHLHRLIDSKLMSLCPGRFHIDHLDPSAVLHDQELFPSAISVGYAGLTG